MSPLLRSKNHSSRDQTTVASSTEIRDGDAQKLELDGNGHSQPSLRCAASTRATRTMEYEECKDYSCREGHSFNETTVGGVTMRSSAAEGANQCLNHDFQLGPFCRKWDGKSSRSPRKPFMREQTFAILYLRLPCRNSLPISLLVHNEGTNALQIQARAFRVAGKFRTFPGPHVKREGA